MNNNCNRDPYRGSGIYDGRNCCQNNDDGLYLAITAVPMQKWRRIYSAEKALLSGTMFGELYLPFMGGAGL